MDARIKKIHNECFLNKKEYTITLVKFMVIVVQFDVVKRG